MSKTSHPKKRPGDYLPRWEAYKHFFNITILRYLVLWFTLVPLVSSLLKGLKTPLVIQGETSQITLQLGLPFSWQLLWLASFFFFLAMAIYYLRCPTFITKYNNYTEYMGYGHDPRWLVWEARTLVIERQGLDILVDRLRRKGFLCEQAKPHDGRENPVVGEKQTQLFFKHEQRNYVLSMPALDEGGKEIDDAERGIFWEIFGRYSGARTVSRVVILVLLVLGGACFLVVLLEHVLSGLNEAWAWLRSLIGSG